MADVSSQVSNGAPLSYHHTIPINGVFPHEFVEVLFAAPG